MAADHLKIPQKEGKPPRQACIYCRISAANHRAHGHVNIPCPDHAYASARLALKAMNSRYYLKHLPWQMAARSSGINNVK
jgi:hypothetical protein